MYSCKHYKIINYVEWQSRFCEILLIVVSVLKPYLLADFLQCKEMGLQFQFHLFPSNLENIVRFTRQKKFVKILSTPIAISFCKILRLVRSILIWNCIGNEPLPHAPLSNQPLTEQVDISLELMHRILIKCRSFFFFILILYYFPKLQEEKGRGREIALLRKFHFYRTFKSAT